jgi:hypothetical protein
MPFRVVGVHSIIYPIWLGSREFNGWCTSVSQLQQADQDSLHLMSMAGYEIENVPVFWRRAQEFNDPQIINGLRNSHPFLQERFLTMEATQKEITEGSKVAIPHMLPISK